MGEVVLDDHVVVVLGVDVPGPRGREQHLQRVVEGRRVDVVDPHTRTGVDPGDVDVARLEQEIAGVFPTPISRSATTRTRPPPRLE